MSSFPILGSLNHTRHYFAQNSHLEDTDELISVTTIEKMGNWIAHKAMTVVCLSVNVTAVGAGLTGAVAAGCLVGGIKVAIFALTLGNTKPSFPTGTTWCIERTTTAAYEVLKNIGELFYDLTDIFYQGFRALRWVFNRLEKGFEKANQNESGFTFSPQFVFPHTIINDATEKYRIDPNNEDRSMEYIAKHTFCSLINIPASCATALLAGCVAAPLFAAIYLSKALLYAGTNIHIPIPTYLGPAIEVSLSASFVAVYDIINIAADIFVTLYHLARALHLETALATARDVIAYIPEAVFG